MNSLEDRELFRTSVSIALEEWDALQASIDHGMGGEHTDDKVQWMIDTIKQYFIDTRNAFDFDDAVNYVEEIMDKEFDTLIEDGSTEIMIRKLMRFFSLNNESKFDELRNMLQEKQNKLDSTKDARKKRISEIKLQEDLDNMDLDDDNENDSDDQSDHSIDKSDNRAKVDADG